MKYPKRPISLNPRRSAQNHTSTREKTLVSLLLGLMVTASTAFAQEYYWSPGGTVSDYQTGGSGIWSTSDANWSSDGTTFSSWSSSTGNNAYFQGTSGTYDIDVSGNFSTGALVFETDGYSLSASSATTMNLGGGIRVNDGVTVTLENNLTMLRNYQGFSISGSDTGTGTLVVNETSSLTTTGNGGSGKGNYYLTQGIEVIVDGGSMTAGNGSSGIRLGDTSGTASANETNTLTIKNNGTVTLVGTGGLQARGVNKNTSKSVLNLDGGTLATTKIGRSNTQFSLNFNGGTLQALAESTNFIYDGDSAGNTTAYVKEGGAIFDTNGFDVTVTQDMIHGGVAAIDGGLIKRGAGTLTLDDSNSYTGLTTVEAGTLLLSENGSITSDVTVLSGGIFGGSGTVTGDITFAEGSSYAFSLNDTLTTSGSIYFEGFGITDLAGLDSATMNGMYNLISGTVNTANLANIGLENAQDLGGGKKAYFEINSLDVVVIPEPSTWALVMISLLAIIPLRRRK
ncbi:autotransporter-associated beta strand repeat-containing protein [Kiritimatiellota bacterium B12222]|nr:autotransporter-associated beta strand repeat-containing protein [Kiritimatiellota bacterium B12222]